MNEIEIKNNISNNNLEKNNKLIKEFKIKLGDEIYLIKLEVEGESLIIKSNKNDMSLNIFYREEYLFNDIYNKNKIFEDCKNIKDIFNIISNNIFDISKLKLILESESNNLIIINDEYNIKFKLKKYYPNENDIIDDIFNKLSLLEEQVNNFTNSGQKITNKLQDYESELEKIIKK